MSSLVLGGASAQLVLFNGGQQPVAAILKSAVAAGTLVLTAAQFQNLELVGVDGSVDFIVQPFGDFGAGDSVLTVQEATEVQALGRDNQPVLLTPVLGSALVP